MRTTSIATLLLLLCVNIMVFAQTNFTLSGTITDENGEPVYAAAIAVKNSANGTYTDERGVYTLYMSSGKQVLAISKIGYASKEVTVDIQANKRLNVVLKESSVNLESVHVYGKSSAQKVRESAFATNALSVQSFVNTSSNLSSIVNRTSGIRIREEGGVGSDFELTINGMSGNSIRYFIDGMPLSSKGSGVNLSNLPVNLIDRVEIYKGVVPSYLGADALGGAVNIITKQEKRNYVDASYSIGSYHTHKFDFNAQFVEKKTGLLIKPTLGLNYSKNDYMMKSVEVWDESQGAYVMSKRKRFHDDYFSLLGQVEAGWANKPWADAFFVSASYSKVNKEIQTGSLQSKVYGEAERRSDAWNLSARYNKKNLFVENLHLNASLSHTWDHSLTVDTAFRKYDWNGNYIESSRNEITGRDRSMRHYKRPLTIVRGNLDYQLNEHHSLNLNYLLNRTGNNRYDDVDSDFDPSNDLLAKHNIGFSYNQSFFESRMNNSFFVKNYINHVEIEQQDLYWLTNSNKVPSSTTKDYWGYGAAVRYAFWDEFALKVSYEHSVRLPLARELLGNGTTVIANVALKPESSENYNIGMYGTARWKGSHQLNCEMNGFIRDADDYIRAVISEKEGLLQYNNESSVFIKGIEGEVKYDYADILHLGINTSYQEALDMNKTLESGKPSITYKNKIPNRPWLFGNFDMDLYFHRLFSKSDKLRIGYNYQYVHWFYLTWEAYGALEGKSIIPTQHQHNAAISYSWNKGRYNVTMECNNLFDKALYDNFMLQKPGRSFACKFRLFINQ